MTIENRIEALERELATAKLRHNHLIIVVLCAIILLVITGLPGVSGSSAVMAQGEPAVAQVIRAHRFVVVDEAGAERAVIGANEKKSWLELFDNSGIKRATLVVDTELPGISPALRLYDEMGEDRVSLVAGKSSGGLWVSDSAGQLRAELCVEDDGPSWITINDEKRKSSVTLETRENNSLLNLVVDKKNSLSFAYPGATLNVSKDGPRLSLSDNLGRKRTEIGATRAVLGDGSTMIYPVSSARFYRADGTIIWKAPE